MSKGHGRIQRTVLDELGQVEYVWLLDLLPESYTQSEYMSLYRAMNSLQAAGLIQTWKYVQKRRGRILISRPGLELPQDRPLCYGDYGMNTELVETLYLAGQPDAFQAWQFETGSREPVQRRPYYYQETATERHRRKAGERRLFQEMMSRL